MAKRKKTMSKSFTRRRPSGMGKIGAVSVNEVGGALVGLVTSRFIINFVATKVKTIDTPVNKAVGQIVLGLATKPVMSILKVKSPMVDAFAKGMMIGGGYELIKQVAPKALGQTDETADVIVINGADEISEINGMDEIGNMDEISEINGMDEIGAMDDEDFFN
jgi:hypothetical protein